jgi:tellurite resistance protein
MRPKTLVILAVVAAAYLLGARAGRERYEQLTGALSSFWNSPDVQKARKKAKREAEKARKRYA